MKFIDLHTHPSTEYYSDPLEIVNEWHSLNMEKLFVCGTNEDDSTQAIELAKKVDFVYPVIGIHPTLSNGLQDREILNKIYEPNVVAIGEVGLDYHYDDSPSKEIQKQGFIAQIDFAKEHNLPVIMHIRDALDDSLDIITLPQYKDINFIFHSFSGDLSFLNKCLRYSNIYYSISGVVTFKNAKPLQEAVKNIPLDRIFCETDTPYLAPTPMRGKPNISPFVQYTYEYIANLKQIDVDVLVEQIKKNVRKVFKIYD